MTWAEPHWLWLLLGVPALALLLAAAGAWHRYKLRRVLSREMVERILPRSVRGRRTIRDLLVLLGWVGLVLALAEPRFDKQVRTLQVRGTDLVLLLDLSRSMDAVDVDPSRLERARREIADLGRQIEGDRVGLVVFAGGAYPRLPLTADFRALQLVVGEAATDTFDTQGSNLGAAIRAGVELLERSQEQAGQALLVLSDGETHQPDDAIAAANEAAAKNIPIFAVGIGERPSPIPLPDGRMLQWRGETVSTEPDFDTMQQVAKLTGGAFVTSSAGPRDMEQLYAEIRKSVKAAERTSQQRETYRSAYQFPLGLGFLALLGAAWLGEGRRAGRQGTALAVALLLVGLASPAARAADPLAEADALYRAQKYPQAVEKLVELSLSRPDDPDVLDRLGSARYRAGDFEGAARAFDRAVELGGTESDALYNAGNAHYYAGRLEDALARYDQALQGDPDHAPAKHNRELVAAELEARRTAQPPPPPKSGDSDENEGSGDESEPKDPKDSDDQKEGKSGSQGGEPQDEGQAGEPKDGPDEPGSSSAVDPGQVNEPGQGEPGEPTSGGGQLGEREGPITAGQAERLLESVEEGSQRTVVQGRPESKPW